MSSPGGSGSRSTGLSDHHAVFIEQEAQERRRTPTRHRAYDGVEPAEVASRTLSALVEQSFSVREVALHDAQIKGNA